MSGQVGEVKEGDLFRVETIDWTAGQIKDNDSAEDMQKVDLSQVTRQLMTCLFRHACAAEDAESIYMPYEMACAGLRAHLLTCKNVWATLCSAGLVCRPGCVRRTDQQELEH